MYDVPTQTHDIRDKDTTCTDLHFQDRDKDKDSQKKLIKMQKSSKNLHLLRRQRFF